MAGNVKRAQARISRRQRLEAEDKCVSGLRMFSGAEREGWIGQMQEALTLTALGQAFHQSAANWRRLSDGWPASSL